MVLSLTTVLSLFCNNKFTIKIFCNILIINKKSAADITLPKQPATSSAIKTVIVYFERQHFKNHLVNLYINQRKNKEIIYNFFRKTFP